MTEHRGIPGTSAADSVEPGADPVCQTCGATPREGAASLLTWSRGTERGRVVWTCDACSRRFLRSIEGKLDSSWW